MGFTSHRLFRPLLRLLLVPGLIPLHAWSAPPPGPSPVPVELARETLSKFFETERLLAKEEGDWRLGRELLRDRISLLKAQIEELKQKTAAEQSTITEADTEREKLRKENEELQAVADAQREQVRELEAAVRGLLPILPGSLASKLRVLSDRLPGAEIAEEEIRPSVSERFQNVLGILNEINKFHGDITVTNERRRVSGDREAEVRVLYLGLAQAFYAGEGALAGEGGHGVPGGNGWDWQPLPDHASRIHDMIRMTANDVVADFVLLPVTIR